MMLAREISLLTLAQEEKSEAHKVVPDAWLLFEQLKGGKHDCFFPVLLEIDWGIEYLQKFKQHVHSRIEFIKKAGRIAKSLVPKR